MGIACGGHPVRQWQLMGKSELMTEQWLNERYKVLHPLGQGALPKPIWRLMSSDRRCAA